mgnify:CR=1 FL=1
MVNARAKGLRGESDFINAFLKLIGRERGPRDRRQNQATIFGGCNNSDVSIPELSDLHIEVKNTSTFKFPAWVKQMRKDCGPGKVMTLAYKEQGKAEFFWLMFPMNDLEKFSCQCAEAFGWRLERD